MLLQPFNLYLLLPFLLSSSTNNKQGIVPFTLAVASSSPLTCRGGGGGESINHKSSACNNNNNDDNNNTSNTKSIVQSILSDIIKSSPAAENDKSINTKLTTYAKSSFASHVSNVKSNDAWTFLYGLSSSPTFVNKVWQTRPLLIRKHETILSLGGGDGGDTKKVEEEEEDGWVNGLFTVEEDLRSIDGTYISGHRTADILRQGIKTDTWEFRSIKDDMTRKTTWKEVKDALDGGTIYFNTAGSLWPTLGALCLLTIEAFGLPANINVYITPPGVTTSVPPHTDRQDVLVFQTAGAKRWRVYAPPPRRKGAADPMNRGKAGDVLSFEELGEPLIDAVIKRGDILYVPAGFPHTTDTCTVVNDDDDDVADDIDVDHHHQETSSSADVVFDETSVHLTMGLDTHVWALTYAHLRWSLLQRAGKNFQLNIEDDDAYWEAMKAISVGFLGGTNGRLSWKQIRDNGGKGELDKNYKDRMIEELKTVMIQLEPNRWNVENDSGTDDDDDDDDNDNDRESLPTDEEFGQVIDYFVRDHLFPLIEIQEEMFKDVDPFNEETVIKAYKCTQKQNAIMEKFGAFSKNEAMRRSFEQSRLAREEKTKGMM